MREHIHRVHWIEPSQFKCNHCDKLLANAAALAKHTKIVHCTERRYVCSVCGARRKTSNSLKMHMETHQISLEYACPLCPKKFNREFNLKIHTKTVHEASAAFPCNLCPKVFKRNTHLLDHCRTHSDATPFQCHACPLAYKTKLALYNHVKIKHDPKVKYKFKTLENSTIVMDCGSSVAQPVGLQ